ncbi:hypothetical protein [Neptunomonas phycophila]|uniref:hypothetical protein n=1 Tax=Neptunomonas phycophila TaxID=1572645 RepID=UPI0026E2D752|nr:hypothetical protein [Neptunomonas phycophila]MDO6467540.1 hypothetical protein [Neptunomonas phycophila]
MSLTGIKLFGEILKEYLLCVSIILAGMWAWHTFSVTERDNIYPQPIIESMLHVELLSNETGLYVKSEVTLINEGNDSVWLELTVPSLSLSTIDFANNTMIPAIISKQKYQAFKDNAMLTYGDINEISISPKSKYKLVYLSKIPDIEHKFVQVSFLTTYRHKELRKSLENQGYSNLTVFTAQATEYVSLSKPI